MQLAGLQKHIFAIDTGISNEPGQARRQGPGRTGAVMLETGHGGTRTGAGLSSNLAKRLQDLATLNAAELTPLSPEVISRQATINIGAMPHPRHVPGSCSCSWAFFAPARSRVDDVSAKRVGHRIGQMSTVA